MIRKYLTLLLVTLFAATALTSCLSEGDETIALENGQPKELIKRGNWRIKEWKGNPPEGLGWKIDDVFKFEDDGTLRKWPKDGKKHRWHWIVDPDNGGGSGSSKTPKGINIDDEYEFGWDSWGRGHWVIYYPRTNPDHPSWVIDFGGEDDNEEYFGEPDEPEEEPEVEEPEVEEPTNIVKRIIVKRDDKERERYDFSYDDKWRIAKVILNNKEVFCYKYDTDYVAITNEKDYLFFGTHLNEKGLAYDAKFEKGYLAAYDKFLTWSIDDTMWNYSYVGNFFCKFSKYKTNTNIDLNCFINGYFDYHHYTPITLLAPFGFLGPRHPYLLAEIGREGYDIAYKYHSYELDKELRVVNVLRYAVWQYNDLFTEAIDTITIEYYPTTTLIEPTPGGHVCYF